MTAKAHAAQDVHFEDPQPIGIGYVFEGLGLEDAKVVDQNVDFRKALNRGASSVRGSEISGQTFEFPRNANFLKSSQGFVNAFGGAAIYDDGGSLPRQALRDREAHAGCGPCDERTFSCELQIHQVLDETTGKKIHPANKQELRDRNTMLGI
jgi:hypothetical protein